MVEVPDSTTRYIDSDSGKPTKDLFNWMRNISQQLSDILSSIGGGLFSSGLPCFSAHKGGTNQGGVANAVFTQITFTELYDIGSYFASNAWTPPSGKVHLCAGFACDVDAPSAGTANGAVILIYKNGTSYKSAIGTTAFGINSGNIAIDDVANGTDAYTVRAFVSSTVGGATETIRGAADSTWFMGHWISP